MSLSVKEILNIGEDSLRRVTSQTLPSTAKSYIVF